MALRKVTQKDRIIAKLKSIHKELGRALMEYDALIAEEDPRPDKKDLILINPLTNKPMKGGGQSERGKRTLSDNRRTKKSNCGVPINQKPGNGSEKIRQKNGKDTEGI